ncbi:MAG: YitT family protein [Firmicutes bacterium]|nr:YitT family protein [Bacillota bacterium]MBQ6842781.1 YitT family protein [Bacillota bacterium]
MKQNLGQRYMWFFVGMVVLNLGVSIVTRASLGTSPIASLAYVLSLGPFGISFGAMSFICMVVQLLLQIAILGKKFPPVQLLQLIVSFASSVALDAAMAVTAFVQPAAFPGRLAAMLIGCAIMALGVALEVAPNVLVLPPDGLVRTIAQVSGRPFHKIKLTYDAVMVAISLLISLLMLHGVHGLGLGTLLSALLCGRFIGYFNRHLPLISRIRALSPAQ